MRFASLRARLLVWLLPPLGMLLWLNLYLAHAHAMSAAQAITDQMLLTSARAIAERIGADDGVLDPMVPPVALEIFDTGQADRPFYAVSSRQGQLVAGYPDMQPPPRHAGVPQGLPLFYDGSYRGLALRQVRLLQPVVGAERDSPAIVVVGITRFHEQAIMRRLGQDVLWQQGLLLLLAAALVIVGLQEGLRPLERVRQAIQGDPRLHRTLALQQVPAELRPLVRALNSVPERMQAQLDAHSRFLQNAAHQMKTPLALLDMQASAAIRARSTPERDEALGALRGTIRQTSRLLTQMLTLARAEPGTREADAAPAGLAAAQPVDLSAATRAVVVLLLPRSVEHGVDLGMEVEGGSEGDAPILVRADQAMLREMILNLVDNAICYTPAGGMVTVRLDGRDQARPMLRIQDSGPGIDASEREHVFERFYRVAGAGGDGSGLGLAIVREIAAAIGASIRLDDGPDGVGLLVSVAFPPAR